MGLKWTVQQARNLLMDMGDAGPRVKFVLHDRDASFTAAFSAVLRARGARVIREYEDFCNAHRPYRALKQAAPLRPLPGSVTSLDQFKVRRRDRAGGVIHEYHLVA